MTAAGLASAVRWLMVLVVFAGLVWLVLEIAPSLPSGDREAPNGRLTHLRCYAESVRS